VQAFTAEHETEVTDSPKEFASAGVANVDAVHAVPLNCIASGEVPLYE
jgi:hypothetical protein